MTVQRDIPGDVQTEIVSTHTVPFFIVKIEFAGGTSYLSESQEVTHEANLYVEGALRVGTFRWNPDGGQEGSIFLFNENNIASALVLNNEIQDVPVTILKVYSTGPTTNTTPVVTVVGVLSGSRIEPKEVALAVLTSNAETQFVPNNFFTIRDGFNWLPPTGTVVVWNEEKYVIEGS